MGGPKKKNSKGKAPSKPAKQVKVRVSPHLTPLQTRLTCTSCLVM